MAEQNQILHIYADLETDSFKGTRLIQIAAITEQGDEFNVFINPQEPLLLPIINLLGINYYQGQLYRKGLKLESFTAKQALHQFADWIEQKQQPVILIFHNGFNFDCKVLIRQFLDHRVKIPSNLIKFGDTLPYFREQIKPPVITNHTLASLAAYFNIKQEAAHCALSDSKTLKQICEAHCKGSDIGIMFRTYNRSIQEYLNNLIWKTPMVKLKALKAAEQLNKD